MNAELRSLWQEAFGDSPEFIDTFFATAYSPDRCGCITEDGRVLAAAYWLDCGYHGGKLAYLYAVATKKEARGRGLCHRLMASIQETLAARGYAGAVLVPGEPGLSGLYGSMGYRFFGGMEEITAAPVGAEALRFVSPEEYGALRREYLPCGGILQEGESLAFLAAQGIRFAAGQDWLLACMPEESGLFGLELLGNREKAPAIVATLGGSTGRFRVPGSKPFAMFKPLGQAPAPTYLGFAFD